MLDTGRLQELKILLIEDDIEFGEMIKTQLKNNARYDYSVKQVISLAEAVSWLDGHVPDLVLLDLGLPDSSGLATFLRLSRKLASVPVIILTVHNDEHTALMAVQEGAQDYLVKAHFSESLLSRSIQYAIERGEILKELSKAKDNAQSSDIHKTRFLANMSHEIRTPMNGILGMLNLVLDRPLEESSRSDLELVRNSAFTLLNLLNNILDYSQIETGKIEHQEETFALTELVSELEAALKPIAREKDLMLSTSIDPQIPEWVTGDREHLRQVLFNLLGNALKFTEEGFCALAVSLEEMRSDSCLLSFAVQDSGIGIPEKVQSDIFDAFVTGQNHPSNYYTGNGLGLAISRELVELMNGQLELTSSPGEGSTFLFYISFAIADRKPATTSNNSPESPGGKSKPARKLKVLLVEDNYINMLIMQRYLENMGHSVASASSGREAEALFAREIPDMIFMDIELPDTTGTKLAETLRNREEARDKTIPVIAVTAYSQEKEQKKLLAAGLDDYIGKPVDFEQLANTIQRNLQS